MVLDEQEPYFLVNDFLAHDKEQLNNVMLEMQHRDPKWKERAIFLRQFTGEVFKAYTRKRGVFADAVKQKEREKQAQKDLLLQKKRELLEELKKVKEAQVKALQEKNAQEQMREKQEQKQPAARDTPQQFIELKPEVQIEPGTEERSKRAQENNQVMQEQQPHEELPASQQEKPLSNQEKIKQWMNDAEIREIICVGPNEGIVIIKNGREIQSEVRLSEEELNQVVQELGKQAQQSLTVENPFLDTQLNPQMKVQAGLGTPYIKGRFAVIKS